MNNIPGNCTQDIANNIKFKCSDKFCHANKGANKGPSYDSHHMGINYKMAVIKCFYQAEWNQEIISEINVITMK